MHALISRDIGQGRGCQVARTYTIWVANEVGLDGPRAAFSVKHELISWLKEQDDPHHFSIYALRDGRQSRVRHYERWVEVLPFEERQMEMTA